MYEILLVDDHPSVMEGTKMMLEKEADFKVSLCNPGGEVVRLVQELSFDLMLFDLNMPGVNGLELAKQVLSVKPDAVILIYTGFDIAPHFNQLVELGVSGFVPKTATQSDLVSAIRHAIRREAVVPLSLLRELHKEAVKSPNALQNENKSLSSKELDIIKEIAKGKSNKTISEQMHMSQRSLEYALTQLFQKMGVSSRVEAVTRAKRGGLLLDNDFL